MPKHIPMRQCLGCREMKPKSELVRVVRTPEGSVVLDKTGRTNGRGAYVCLNIACMNRAIKTRALSRALGTTIPQETADDLLSKGAG